LGLKTSIQTPRSVSGILQLLDPDSSAGTRSGTSLRFVETGGNLCVLAQRNPLPKWANTLMSTSFARWRLGDKVFTGRVERVTDFATLRELSKQFEEAFGEAQVRQWFKDSLEGFALQPNVPAGDSPDQVRRYFDAIAGTYDATVESNPLDSELRQISIRLLKSLFRPGDRVLEIGSGTGLETIPLVREGIRVLATDVSGGMLAQLESKSRAEGLDPMVRTRRIRASELADLLKEEQATSLDGAFSTFGALDCEPDLSFAQPVLARLLRLHAPLVLGLWNRFCASDFVLSLLARKPRRTLARLFPPVVNGRSRFPVAVYPRSVGSVLAAFRNSFRVERIVGVPVFVPPYDFAPRFLGQRGFLDLLRKADASLAGRFPFNRIGDHIFVVLRRTA
jgi:SAM-dependent methyltransferase